MKDSLLTSRKKSEIINCIKSKNFTEIILILNQIKTRHAGTAKMKDKRFVINKIVTDIESRSRNKAKDYFNTGKFFCMKKDDTSKEIGVSLIWRGYKYNRKIVENCLIKTADDSNWEVREYAGGAFANTLNSNPEFYIKLKMLTKHKSENVRRAVVFSALGLLEKENPEKAFKLLEPLLYDSSAYVKRNLGPFIIGSYFFRKFPEATLRQMKKWSRIKNENVRWNIIMSFKNSFGLNNPEYAFEILKEFTQEKDKMTCRVLKSVLNFLSKKHKHSVDRFKENFEI